MQIFAASFNFLPNKRNFAAETIQEQKLYREIRYNKRLEKKTIEYNGWILYVEHIG